MVVTIDKVIEAQSFATGTSAQKAELIALTRVLELSQGKNVNIYTDSKYAFIVLHAHGAIWKERELLILGSKNIKHAKEILQLPEAVNLLNQIALMPCPGHQKNGPQTSQETKLLIKQTKQAAQGQSFLGALIPHLDLSESKPYYT